MRRETLKSELKVEKHTSHIFLGDKYEESINIKNPYKTENLIYN